MKRILTIALAALLIAGLFTGCEIRKTITDREIDEMVDEIESVATKAASALSELSEETEKSTEEISSKSEREDSDVYLNYYSELESAYESVLQHLEEELDKIEEAIETLDK